MIFFGYMLLFWKRMSICFANSVEEPFEPPHDKTNNMAVRPAKTQIILGIRPVWSESSLSAWRKVGTLLWTHSEGSEMSEIEPVWGFQCYRKARMHFTGLYWFRLSFMGWFASQYFPVELDEGAGGGGAGIL